MDLSDRLRRARLAAGVTQAELSERTGMPQPVISAFERGSREVTEDSARRILEALDVRPRELLAASRDKLDRIFRSYGVTDAMVFGSVARGTDDPGSDIDILVTFPPATSFGTIHQLERELEDLLGVDVDVISAGGLRPSRPDHAAILREAVPV